MGSRIVLDVEFSVTAKAFPLSSGLKDAGTYAGPQFIYDFTGSFAGFGVLRDVKGNRSQRAWPPPP